MTRRRRLLRDLLCLAAVVGLYFAASGLVAARPAPSSVLTGAVKQPGGYRYVVRPGDTLWSIASKLEPAADPRPLMDQLSAQVHGGAIIPGETLFIALSQ